MNKQLKKIASILAILALLAMPVAVYADCVDDFDLSDCGPTSVDPTVDVTQGVTNDVDSGVGGNYWAYDDYQRSIRVWEIEESWYAVVQYNGQFETVAGTSPNATGTVGEGVTGTMQGGYVAYVSGDMLEQSGWPTQGYVGSFDYQGDPETGEIPGAVSWPTQYFDDDFVFEYAWWGWQYLPVCESNGSWVNSQDGNAGDIVGDPDLSCLPPPQPVKPTSGDIGCSYTQLVRLEGDLPAGTVFVMSFLEDPEAMTLTSGGHEMGVVKGSVAGAAQYTEPHQSGEGLTTAWEGVLLGGNETVVTFQANVLLQNCRGSVGVMFFPAGGSPYLAGLQGIGEPTIGVVRSTAETIVTDLQPAPAEKYGP